MTDGEARDAIIELTDEVERWQQKLLEERKAHEATLADLRSELAATRVARDEWERRAEDVLLEKLQGEAQLVEYALARLVSPARAEIADAISDFWEAEAARGRAIKLSWGSDQALFEAWDGSTGDEDRCWVPGRRPVPRIVWWHAHRRTR